LLNRCATLFNFAHYFLLVKLTRIRFRNTPLITIVRFCNPFKSRSKTDDGKEGSSKTAKQIRQEKIDKYFCAKKKSEQQQQEQREAKETKQTMVDPPPPRLEKQEDHGAEEKKDDDDEPTSPAASDKSEETSTANNDNLMTSFDNVETDKSGEQPALQQADTTSSNLLCGCF
jgi:hypothetical protein